MKGQKPGTYNIMRKFRIGEVSSVDHPAQGGARMEIMKRAEVEKQTAMTDAVDGYAHLLHGVDESSHGETSTAGSEGNYHTHPWLMGPTGEIVVGESNGHTHRVGLFSKTDEPHSTSAQLSASSEPSEPADGNPTEDPTMNESEFNEKIEAMQKQLDESTADRDSYKAVSGMNDLQKAHYATLKGDDRKSFAESDQKDAEIRKANEADPVVGEFEGKEIRKSDDPTGVLTALLQKAKHDKKKSDKDEEDKKKFLFEAKKADLEKRVATGNYGNLPGNDEMKAEMLKALDSIEDEGVREAAHAALVAKNKELESAFTEVGTVGTPDPISKSLTDQLDVMRDAVMKDQPKLSKSQAYVVAVESTEGLVIYEKMQNPQEVN